MKKSDLTFDIPHKLFSFICHFLKPHKLKILCLFAVSIVVAIDLSLRPYMIKLLIDRVARYQPNDGSLWLVLAFPTCGYLLSMCMLTLVFRIYDAVRLHLMPKLQADITYTMFEYIQQHSQNFFHNNMSGYVSSQIKEMAYGVKEILKLMINRFFAHFLSLFIAVLTLAKVHILLAFILLSWTIFFLYMTFKLSKKSHALAKELSHKQNVTQGKIVDSISNIMTVKLFAQNQKELAELKQQLAHQIDAGKNLERCMLKIRTIQSSSVIVMITLLLVVLINAHHYNLVTVGDFALTVTLSLSISQTIWNISDDFVTFSEFVGRCNQALSLIILPHEIVDHPQATDLVIKNGDITFSKVSFTYPNNSVLFSNLSLHIPGGQKIGLVGFSGGGKSTFANLIIRIFDIQAGTIAIDEQDIRTVTQKSLHQCVSFIPQDPVLFHRSIKENIAYGCSNPKDQDIVLAAQKAHAHDFINRLPNGYGTLVGERGTKLSGGQRQRIAIARAFLKNSPILILDEATSSLDSQTETYIQESLDRLFVHKTVIIIAHRLSTLLYMDKIIVFDQGAIAEEGTHQELIKRNGPYARLWNSQIGGFLPDPEIKIPQGIDVSNPMY